MYCKNCGNELPESAKFCGKCGVKVETVVSDVNKKSAFTKKHMIMITAVGCILIFAIIMVVLLWKKPSQDTDAVAENTTESIEESTQEEETVAVTAETEETEGEIEEAKLQYYLARATKYRRGFIESVSEYNSDGNEVSCVYYNEDGSVNSRYEREYDSAGNEVRFISYKEDGSVNSKREYEYDVTGNCISNIFYNEDGEIIDSWKSEYDNTGNAIKCVTYNADGSISVRSEYEYDSAGNEISFAEYNGDGNLYSKSESEYDSSGRVIKNESYYAYSNENWMTEYEYDSSGNLIKDKTYVNGEIAFINEYDSNGDYVYSINYYAYYDSDGQEFRYEYKYDNNGKCLLNKKYYYPQGDIYWLEEKKYDEQGRIVEERNYEYSEMAFGDERRYYEYDNNGNLMKEEVYSYDENGAELDFVENIYEYKTKEEFEFSSNESEGIHRYELITADMTQEEAFKDCLNRGGYLVHINSEEEFNAIINQTREEQKKILHFGWVLSTIMQKLSFQDGITVNSIKLEILDEAGNTVQDEQLLPAMYLFGKFEEMAEIEAEPEEQEEKNNKQCECK